MTVTANQGEVERSLVSVIVAVRNGARNLQRCIDSVVGQSLSSRELIVMDGGSTDGTLDILQAGGSGVDYWESAPDRGIYHAWNKAIARARGDWLCFLGADDYLWAPDTLERFRPHLEAARPQHKVVYGAVAVVSRTGETIALIDQPWAQARRRFFVAMSIPHPGMFHHRSLFAEHGPFDESFRQAGDYEFLLREFKVRAPFYVPGLIQAGYEEGGVTTRLDAILRGARERRRALIANGIPPTPGRTAWTCLEDLGRVGLRNLFGESAMRRVQRKYRSIVQRGRPKTSAGMRSQEDIT